MSPYLEHIDKPQTNCGVIGVYNHPQASVMAYYALHSLQHRGQEAAGIVSSYFDKEKDKTRFFTHKDEGLVLDIFNEKILTDTLKGTAAIGHNRYSTTGGNSVANIQPFHINYHMGNLALAHNGNLTNTRALRKKLSEKGSIFQSTSDSELFLHIIARSSKKTKVEQIKEALQTVKGAFSVVVMTNNKLIAARDPHGFRPLSIGKKKIGDTYAYFVASETCAFDILSAEYVRDVRHNEMIVIDKNTISTGIIASHKIVDVTPKAKQCVFEYIYFSRPDSKVFGHSVDKIRRKLGKKLAEQSPVSSDHEEKVVVIPVPDSGNTSTLGYARVNQKQGIPTRYEIGLIRSHYVGRTFIAPGQESREFKVKTKFNVVKGVVEGRKIVVVDDSIVRGTTSRSLIKMIREASPKEIHMRITSPPVKFPCRYGMDFPSKEELIANQMGSVEEIGQYLGADSLEYLTTEKLFEAVPQDDNIGYCDACFTGKYPVEIEADSGKLLTEEL